MFILFMYAHCSTIFMHFSIIYLYYIGFFCNTIIFYEEMFIARDKVISHFSFQYLNLKLEISNYLNIGTMVGYNFW